MGLSAEVLAVGPFNSSIVRYLEYAPEQYSETRRGVPVVRHLFGVSEGSSVSRELASSLGLADVWDFNKHKLDPAAFNRSALASFVVTYPDYEKDLEALFALAQAGFDLYFLPNG